VDLLLVVHERPVHVGGDEPDVRAGAQAARARRGRGGGSRAPATLAVERLPHPPAEHVRGEGLWAGAGVDVGEAAAGEVARCVADMNRTAGPGREGAEPTRPGRAGEAGHDDVGDEEVDRGPRGARRGRGLLAAHRLERAVAVGLEASQRRGSGIAGSSSTTRTVSPPIERGGAGRLDRRRGRAVVGGELDAGTTRRGRLAVPLIWPRICCTMP